MAAEFMTAVASGITVISTIKNLLKKSEPGLFEIKQVVINGIADTILFTIHFTKTTENKAILRRIFSSGEVNRFDKGYEITITDQVGYEITNEIVEFDGAIYTIPFEKFFNIPGRSFIITVKGRFQQDYNNIFTLASQEEPIILNEHNVVYKTQVIVHSKIYKAEELIFIRIPFRQIVPLDFLGPKLFTSIELKSYKHLNHAKKHSSIQSRRSRMLAQKWGFNPDNYQIVVPAFLQRLEDLIARRFREFITVTSETHNVDLSQARLEFPRIQDFGLPQMAIRPTICFDYSNKDPTVIDILLSINKDAFLDMALKLWRKFKGPKRTAPKKTLK